MIWKENKIYIITLKERGDCLFKFIRDDGIVLWLWNFETQHVEWIYTINVIKSRLATKEERQQIICDAI